MALGLLLIRCDFFYRKILRKRSLFRKVVTWTCILLTITIVGLYKLIVSSNHPFAITKSYIYIEPLNSFFRQARTSNETRDWNDYRWMKEERTRFGYGEHGLKTYRDAESPAVEEALMQENGHNALVSDKISLDRAVPDLRSVECKKKLYRSELPTVSIIIPFYDEHLTTLLRTIHSLINRTPSELLKEIVLVNDASTRETLYESLQTHLEAQSWRGKVKLFMMNERSGLIWSRLAGARFATGDVLLFLDCHVEAGHNYLPPLLDPIVDDYRAVVIPTLDIIDKKTYEIRPLGEGRTVFDWSFHPQRIPLLKKDEYHRGGYFKTPIMYGAAFAISAKFFWELNPDSGLKIYGGDQFEMSFKVNLCGGTLYEHPCSRIAHIYRRFPYFKHQNGTDYKARNNKRVVEIWLDGYKKYFYDRHPERYENLDVGDLTPQLLLKQKLNCRPFSYFLEVVAPDMLERFPLEEFKDFASGTIRNRAIDKCIQTTDKDHGGHINLAKCSNNKTNPIQQQHFVLRHFRDIMIHGKSDCLEGSTEGLTYERCHYEQGNQYFRYDIDTLQIRWNKNYFNLCIDVDPDTEVVFINGCSAKRPTQKWVWGFSRVSWLKNWVNHGAPILDEAELKDLSYLSGHSKNHRRKVEEIESIHESDADLDVTSIEPVHDDEQVKHKKKVNNPQNMPKVRIIEVARVEQKKVDDEFKRIQDKPKNIEAE